MQSGFLTLHSLVRIASFSLFDTRLITPQVMIMKMHSYMTVNGYLQTVSVQSQSVLDQLREATKSVGGWDKALADAEAHRAELDAATGSGSASATQDGSGVGTPSVPAGSQSSYVDVPTATALRKRLNGLRDGTVDAKTAINGPSETAEKPDGVQPDGLPPSPAEPHPLIDHPSEKISDLANEYSELQGELTSTGPNYVVWPNNISYKNFAVYQLIPTLVYDLEYPRTDR